MIYLQFKDFLNFKQIVIIDINIIFYKNEDHKNKLIGRYFVKSKKFNKKQYSIC